MGKIKLYFIKFYIVKILSFCDPVPIIPQYWSFLLHVLFIRVYGDKDSNAMRINNCSLVGCKRKEKGFSNPPSPKKQNKTKNKTTKCPLCQIFH